MAKTPHGALLLPILLLSAGAPQGSRVPEAHAILNAKIVVGDGSTIEKGRVIVRDGRIEAVDGDTTAPPDARIVDAAGLTVYPGFIDADAIIGITPPPIPNEGAAPDATAGAMATMREIRRKGIRPDVSAVSLLDITDEAANPRKQAGFALALCSPPAAIVGGRASLAELSGNPRREVIVRADVALAAELRPPQGEAGYPSSLMGAVAEFRQTILDGDWYRKSWKAYREHTNQMRMPPNDPLLAALEPVLDKSMPVAFDANSPAEILRAIAVAEELGLKPWIVGGTDAWQCAAVLAQKQIPVLLSLDYGTEPKDPAESRRAESGPGSRPRRGDSPPASAPASTPASVPASTPASSGPAESAPETKPAAWPDPDTLSARVRADRKRRYEEKVENAGKLVNAGVKVFLTTRGLRTAADFHAALAKAVEKGLTRDAALAALTGGTAQLFGTQDSAGRIAAGRPAYVTIVKGNLGDKDLKVRHLFVGNKRFDYDDEGGDAGGASRPAGGRRRPPRDTKNTSGGGHDDDGAPQDDGAELPIDGKGGAR